MGVVGRVLGWVTLSWEVMMDSSVRGGPLYQEHVEVVIMEGYRVTSSLILYS